MIINKKLISNKILPEDYTYNSRDHTLTVYIGDVCGLDKYKVEFEAIINEKALDSEKCEFTMSKLK